MPQQFYELTKMLAEYSKLCGMKDEVINYFSVFNGERRG
jgi:hypothetical protein